MVGVNIRKELYKRAVLLNVDDEMSEVVNRLYSEYLDEKEIERNRESD